MAFDEAPPFWWHRRAWQAWLLWPVSWAYGKVSAHRMNRPPTYRADAAVICVGNFIAGGAGKTPTALSLCRTAKEMGRNPGFLTRGYGGAIHHATIVDLSTHNSHDVGDEALVLAETAMTAVSPDRPAGARLLVEQGCDLIIMDDGFQNPYLHKDYCLVVVDARRGLGNGHVIPGGPLRVPLASQLYKTDGLLIVGKGNEGDQVIRLAARGGKPVFQSHMDYHDKEHFKGKWMCAYAGIGYPEKFFASLTELGAEIVDRYSFGDHHRFSDEECEEILAKAKMLEAHLVTTQKDAARLRGMGEMQEKLLAASNVLQIDLEFENSESPKRIIRKALSRYKARRV